MCSWIPHALLSTTVHFSHSGATTPAFERPRPRPRSNAPGRLQVATTVVDPHPRKAMAATARPVADMSPVLRNPQQQSPPQNTSSSTRNVPQQNISHETSTAKRQAVEVRPKQNSAATVDWAQPTTVVVRGEGAPSSALPAITSSTPNSAAATRTRTATATANVVSSSSPPYADRVRVKLRII